MTPLNDSVIIKDLTEEETETASGIILNKETPKAHRPGEVVEVGKGYRRPDGEFTPLTVKKGDKVLFHFATGREHDIDGKKLSVCTEANIVVVLDK